MSCPTPVSCAQPTLCLPRFKPHYSSHSKRGSTRIRFVCYTPALVTINPLGVTHLSGGGKLLSWHTGQCQQPSLVSFRLHSHPRQWGPFKIPSNFQVVAGRGSPRTGGREFAGRGPGAACTWGLAHRHSPPASRQPGLESQGSVAQPAGVCLQSATLGWLVTWQ